MKTIRLFLIPILGLLAASMTVPAARAQTETLYFCTNNGNWSSGANWYLTYDSGSGTCSDVANHIPGVEDHVIIIANVTCNMDQLSADGADLTVQSGAVLNIQGHTLRITGQSGDTASDITGTIYLTVSTSTLQFTTNDQSLEGSGKVVGQHADARILLGGDRILTNKMIIEGILKITDAQLAATFKNDGTVNANGSGTLLVDVDHLSDDTALGLWRVSAAGATLNIDAADPTADVLDADFTVELGTCDLNDPGFETTGTLTFTGGTIDCAGLTGTSVAKFTGS